MSNSIETAAVLAILRWKLEAGYPPNETQSGLEQPEHPGRAITPAGRVGKVRKDKFRVGLGRGGKKHNADHDDARQRPIHCMKLVGYHGGMEVTYRRPHSSGFGWDMRKCSTARQ